jgi:hypothetical protein
MTVSSFIVKFYYEDDKVGRVLRSNFEDTYAVR